MMVTVELVARPVPFTRTGSRNGRRYTPTRYREWRHLFAWACQQTHRGDPHPGPVAVSVTVATDYTHATFGFDTGDGFPPLPTVTPRGRPKHIRGDLDNYVKAVLDAAQGILFCDDRQVVHIEARFA